MSSWDTTNSPLITSEYMIHYLDLRPNDNTEVSDTDTIISALLDENSKGYIAKKYDHPSNTDMNIPACSHSRLLQLFLI